MRITTATVFPAPGVTRTAMDCPTFLWSTISAVPSFIATTGMGDGTFQNVGRQASVEMGRWSWSSDFWDFDHDGYSDLYVANGYLSGVERTDMASFFWRQVVAKSSEDATGALAYERGWNAI